MRYRRKLLIWFCQINQIWVSLRCFLLPIWLSSQPVNFFFGLDFLIFLVLFILTWKSSVGCTTWCPSLFIVSWVTAMAVHRSVVAFRHTRNRYIQSIEQMCQPLTLPFQFLFKVLWHSLHQLHYIQHILHCSLYCQTEDTFGYGW